MKINLLNLVIILLCTQSTFAQRLYWMSVEDLNIKESCGGDYVRYNLKVYQDMPADITLKYLGSNLPSLQIYLGNKPISKDDIIPKSQYHELKFLNTEFVINKQIKEPYILFEQIQCNISKVSKIRIHYGQYLINKFINDLNISDACQDSVDLHFPNIATQTDMSLVAKKDGQQIWNIHKTYYCCNWDNSIRISKNDHFEFEINLRGCYSSRASYSFKTY